MGSEAVLRGAHFAFSQQAVSRHLQVLAEAGLVTVKASGRQRLDAVDRLKRAVETKRGR